MSQPLVSVIIPCYNSAAYLPEAIESVLSQSYRNFELIVVNDGSTDNTDEMVQPYLDRIIYIKQENAGPAAARNRGIMQARGEFVAFNDADDVWLADKILKQVDVLNKSSEVAFVYTQIKEFGDNYNGDVSAFPVKPPAGMIFEEILLNNFIALPSVMVRKKVLQEFCYFDEGLLTAEDTNMWLKIAYKYPVEALREVLLLRRHHADNLSGRYNIRLGTLDSLDRIVALYPDVAPDRYEPMWRAYKTKGEGTATDYFYFGNYRECRQMCQRLFAMKIMNKALVKLYLITLLPAAVINMLRKSARLPRQV